MAEFLNFGSIDQFKGAIKSVSDHCKHAQKPLPELEFIGTIKLHGTNAGIGFNNLTKELWCQTRERVITPFDDNFGFARYVYEKKDYFTGLMQAYADKAGTPEVVVAYGEWAGQGIQKSVGISLVPKQLYLFTVKVFDGFVDGEPDRAVRQLAPDEVNDVLAEYDTAAYPLVYCVYDTTRFPLYRILIDFANPVFVQNTLVALTVAVEEECPVAKYFGQSGIGEGIVWLYPEYNIKFKVKGEKHSVSKVKTIKEIAPIDIARHESMKVFVDSVVTENRLQQGLTKLGEMGLAIDQKNTGAFLKWVGGDVLKEEMDTIIENGYDRQALMPLVNGAAKQFWFKTLDALVGL